MDTSARWLRWAPIPVAVTLALVGWVVLRATLGASSAEPAHTGPYESGGLLLTVNRTESLPHNMDGGGPAAGGPTSGGLGSFQMPQSMMPGMQTADQDRIHIEVSLRNPSQDAKPLRHDDFRMVSRSGGRWDVNEASFTPATLAPGFSVNLDLYFDIPLAEKDLSVEWSAGRSPVEIPIVVGETPAHGHQP